jgi:3-oxoacyl-[acyl-carrier protein] reductase
MVKSVLISGASRGIGLETAKALSQGDSEFGCVVMIARQSSVFDEALKMVRQKAGRRKIVAIEADLSNPLVVDSIYDRLDAEGIKLMTIINNAGFTKPSSLIEAELADFETTMRVNLFSPFKLIQVALRRSHPLTQIINIASTAGLNGRSGWLTYSSSKAAIINMSEVLREELRPYGIDVVCLSPGRCATDLRRTLAPDEDPSTIMQPEQVASIIKLMTTKTGALLNSQNLVVRT